MKTGVFAPDETTYKYKLSPHSLYEQAVKQQTGSGPCWSSGQWRLITGGNGKFLPGPALIRMMVGGETGFPL